MYSSTKCHVFHKVTFLVCKIFTVYINDVLNLNVQLQVQRFKPPLAVKLISRTTSWSKPIPVNARCKGWVCGRSLVGIAGWNPAGGMDICLLRVVCAVRKRALRPADHSFRGVVPSVVCL